MNDSWPSDDFSIFMVSENHSHKQHRSVGVWHVLLPTWEDLKIGRLFQDIVVRPLGAQLMRNQLGIAGCCWWPSSMTSQLESDEFIAAQAASNNGCRWAQSHMSDWRVFSESACPHIIDHLQKTVAFGMVSDNRMSPFAYTAIQIHISTSCRSSLSVSFFLAGLGYVKRSSSLPPCKSTYATLHKQGSWSDLRLEDVYLLRLRSKDQWLLPLTMMVSVAAGWTAIDFCYVWIAVGIILWCRCMREPEYWIYVLVCLLNHLK